MVRKRAKVVEMHTGLNARVMWVVSRGFHTAIGSVWFGLVPFDHSASVTSRYHRRADRCI